MCFIAKLGTDPCNKEPMHFGLYKWVCSKQVFVKEYIRFFLGALEAACLKQGVGERPSSSDSLCFKGIVYTLPYILSENTVKPSFKDKIR